MLTPQQRALLYSTMHALLASAGSIDSRRLIDLTVQALSAQIPLITRYHAAGMLAALKYAGAKFSVKQPGRVTIVVI